MGLEHAWIHIVRFSSLFSKSSLTFREEALRNMNLRKGNNKIIRVGNPARDWNGWGREKEKAREKNLPLGTWICNMIFQSVNYTTAFTGHMP